MVNFEVLAGSFSEMVDKKIFPDAEVGGGASAINSICSRPEVAEYVISGCNVDTFGTTRQRIWELLASAVFQKIEIEISHLCNALTTVCPFVAHFRAQEAEMSNDSHNSE